MVRVTGGWRVSELPPTITLIAPVSPTHLFVGVSQYLRSEMRSGIVTVVGVLPMGMGVRTKPLSSLTLECPVRLVFGYETNTKDTSLPATVPMLVTGTVTFT